MPELPEVQTVVDTLRPALVGKTIATVHLWRNDIVTPEKCKLPKLLAGRQITSIDRRGKRIIFTLENGNRFYIHLGMSGRLNVVSENETKRPHTHFEFNAGGRCVRFSDPAKVWGHLVARAECCTR